MAKIEEDFPHDMYRFLPKFLREVDQGQTNLIERFFSGPQLVWEGTYDLIQNLDTLHDIDQIRDEYLQYLKWLVGWTSEPALEAITNELTDDELRKLIRASAALWRRKGTELGLEEALRVITGRDVVIWNWFEVRWIVDVTALWRLGQESDPWVVGSDHGDHDEYLTLVWIHNEVGIQRSLIRKVINLNRPLQERVSVAYADLVDDFRFGRQKWVTDTAPDVDWDEDQFRLIVSPGTVIRANVPALDEAQEVLWRMRCAFSSSSGGAVQMEFRRDEDLPNDRYRATWGQDGSLELEVVQSGIATSLATASLGHSLPQGETTVIGVTVVRNCDGQLRIAIVVYDDDVIEILVDEPQLLPPGQWRFANIAPGDVAIDDVIAYALPLTVDVVSALGETVGATSEVAPAPCVVAQPSLGGFTLTGLWHLTTHRYLTPAQSLYFGTGETGYHTWGVSGSMGAGITAGTATSATIDLTDYPAGEYRVFLDWWQYSEIRQQAGDDVAIVEIRVGGVTVQTITKASIFGGGSGVAIDQGRQRHEITDAAAGEIIVVRFNIDTVTAPTAGSDGWFVDDVKVLVGEA